MVCPKCKSENVNVQLRSGGITLKSNRYRTGIKSSWFIPAERTSHDSNRKYESIAICQDCGYLWKVQQPLKFSEWVTVIGFFIVIFFLIRSCSMSPSEGDNGNDVNSSVSEPVSIWATEYTPLDEFEYYIDEEEIHLKKYRGRSDKVYIAAAYDYNGRELPVVSLEGGMFFGSVDSIIISEGIKEIDYAAFNSSGVENLYFPSSVDKFSGFSFVHGGKTLYYGGTKEMWKELYPYDRADLDFVEVICDSTIDDLM